MVQSIDARDRYTVVFTLKEPFASFPVNLVMPIVPDGAGPRTFASIRSAPVRTASSATRSTTGSSSRRSTTTSAAAPRNDGLVLQVVPDDIMRGLELRKGTMDIVVNDLAPDIVHQLGRDPAAADRRSRRGPTISTSA